MASYNSPKITDLGTLADLTLQGAGKTGGKLDGGQVNNVPLGGDLTFS